MKASEKCVLWAGFSSYSKCSKALNPILFLFSNKYWLLSFKSGIHKILDRIANREDPDQTWVCLSCLSGPFLVGKLCSKILEHLPYFELSGLDFS